MNLSYTNRYKLFKISWVILLLGVICDFGLFQNMPMLFIKVNVQASSIASILYVFIFFIAIPVNEIRKNISQFDNKIIITLAALLVMAFVSSYFSDLRGFAIGMTIFRYTLFFFCLICTVIYNSFFKDSSKYILKSFIYFNFVIIISSLVDFYVPAFDNALVKYFGHMSTNTFVLRINGIQYIRPSGFITDTNLTAFTLTLSCLLLLLNSRSFNKYFVYLFYLLAGFSFGMLASRSALVVVFISTLLFWVFRYVNRKHAFIFLLLFILVQLLTPQTQARISQLFDKEYMEEEADVGRPLIWKADIIAFKTKPLIGIGTGIFFKESDYFLAEAKGMPLNPSKIENQPGPEYKQDGGINPHNIFLVMLTEYGIIGFLIFLLLLVLFTKELIIRKQFISIIIFSGILFVSSLSNYAPYYKYYLLISIICYTLCKNNMLIRNEEAIES